MKKLKLKGTTKQSIIPSNIKAPLKGLFLILLRPAIEFAFIFTFLVFFNNNTEAYLFHYDMGTILMVIGFIWILGLFISFPIIII